MNCIYRPPDGCSNILTLHLRVFHLCSGLEFSWTFWCCGAPGATLWAPVQSVYEQLFFKKKVFHFFASLPPLGVFHYILIPVSMRWTDFCTLNLWRCLLQKRGVPSEVLLSYSQGILSRQSLLSDLHWLAPDIDLHLSHCWILCSWFASQPPNLDPFVKV